LDSHDLAYRQHWRVAAGRICEELRMLSAVRIEEIIGIDFRFWIFDLAQMSVAKELWFLPSTLDHMNGRISAEAPLLPV
jgi:hypothetical protein